MSALLPPGRGGFPRPPRCRASALPAAQLYRKDGERSASAFWGHIAKHPVSGPMVVHTEARPLPDHPRGFRGHTAHSSLSPAPSHRILNSCTDLMKVSGRLGPQRRAGSAAGMATPRVTYVLVLAGHSAPGDNIHQPAEGDRGEWQGELGLQVGSFPVGQATQLGQQQGSVPGGDMTAGSSSSQTAPPCGLSWT